MVNNGRMGFQKFVNAVAEKARFIESNICLDILNGSHDNVVDHETKMRFKLELMQLHEYGYYITSKDGKFVTSNKNLENLQKQIGNVEAMVNGIFLQVGEK